MNRQEVLAQITDFINDPESPCAEHFDTDGDVENFEGLGDELKVFCEALDQNEEESAAEEDKE